MKKTTKSLFAALIAASVFVPVVSSAQIVGLPTSGDLKAPVQGAQSQASSQDKVLKTVDTGSIGSDDPNSSVFQLVTCSGVDDPRTSDKIEVECDYNQLVQTAYRIVKYVLFMLIPVLLGMVLYTGWQFLTAGGDTMKLDHAKKMLKPVFIGLILIFGAWLFVYTVLDRLLADQIGGVKKTDIVPAKAN